MITQSNSSETSTSNTITITATENATANVTVKDVNIAISDPSGSPQNHSGQAAVTIDVADGAEANVTLDSVKIDVDGTGGLTSDYIPGEAAVQITGNGDVTLELDGENTLQSGMHRAGVEKNTTAATEAEPANGTGKLTITDETGTDGTLKATGGKNGAGIGGGISGTGSNITISGSAEVTAQGGWSGAGIGGGCSGSGRDITIEGNAEVTATGGYDGSGIGGGSVGSGSDITIQGNAEVTANGGIYGAGIGGGENGSGSDITIAGSAEVTATGGLHSSGIGGGYRSTGSDITVSEGAQVKAQGGKAGQMGSNHFGAGAAIGDGGDWSGNNPANIDGEEKTPDTAALNEGWIATYTPGTTDLDTAIPDSLTYMDDSNSLKKAKENITLKPAQSATCTEDGHEAGFSVDGTLVAVTIPKTGHSFTNYVSDNNATYEKDGTKTAKCDHCDATHTIPDPGSKLVREASLYRVLGQDGKALACKTARKDGVLTITVDADFASLTGTLGGIRTLKAQGVDTIVFVTKGATSGFALSDLLAQGNFGDAYKLTHDGETVTFTLGKKKIDVTAILAKP